MSGKRLNEAGETWDDDYGLDPKPLPCYLDCAMCGASRCFVIDPNDEAVGYCFKEKKAWRLYAKGGKQ